MSEEKAFDVVCGMELALEHIAYASEYEGKTYSFCSKSCKKHFDDDPARYAASE